MLKRLKSVSMLLFLMGTTTGAAYAVPVSGITDVEITQQSETCTGVVKDGTGETVIGASVIVKGTTNGTITDFDGNFTLTNVKNGDVIQISFVGYKTQEIKYVGQSLNIILKDDTEVLDEVVITGYGGSQKRAALTTAISKLDNSVLKNAAYSNAGQSLQGSVTGLRVVNTTGQPGTNPDITLRGGATITGENSNALVVVDGIVRNSMSDVNPSDIESIQILKDAASTAIYGARANGGVILIETKSGKEGKTSINYKFKIGKNFTRKGYEFCNAEDYIYYNRLGYLRTGRTNVDTQQGYGIGNSLFDIQYLTDDNAHLKNEGWSVMDDPFYEGKQILFKDYSGQLDDEVFSSSAITQDHYLNITGGNDKSTFASSLGYYNEDGMIKGTGFQRFSGSFNASYKILPILNVKAGVSYVWSTRPELWIGSYEFFYRTRSQRPTWNPWNEDGTPAAGFGTGDGNPAYYRDKLTQKNSTTRATYNIGFTLDILPKQLVLNGNASLLNYDYQREKFNKAYQTQTTTTPETTRQAEAWVQKYQQVQLNASLTYTGTFAEKHNLEAMIGGEYYTYNQFDFEAKTQGSPTDDVPTLNVGSNRTFTRTEKTAYRILSGFGRINYNYNMKYLLSFTARYDGISRLKDNRWGFFPGVSVGWNVMEEDFWKDSKVSGVISNLKPRVSYGVNGNVNGIGNYEVYGEYAQVESKNYGGATGLTIPNC
jgi:TonB-linked SusC/RagA family outer membrane protein